MQQALEEAIVADPDDLAAHMAYADWLSEQPEPRLRARGEFVQVQLALENDSHAAVARQRLQAREAELLAAHRDEWLGPLAQHFEPEDEPDASCRFARGWIDSLHIDRLDVALARALVDAPQVRLLRRLVMFGCAEEPEEYEGLDSASVFFALSALQQARFFGNVRVLQLGDIDGANNFATYPDALYLRELIGTMPRLRELNLNAFEVLNDELFAALKRRSLHTLRLERVRLHDPGIRALAQSGLLKQLKVLQLWNARFTDDGAAALARKRDLRNLELLDVSFNWLTPTGVETLRKTGVNLAAEYQMTADQDNDTDEADAIPDEYDDDWE